MCKRDIEECLRNDCCHGKASTVYYEGVSLALANQHAEYMSSVVCLVIPCFFTFYHIWHDFWEKRGGIENKMCVLISLQLLSEIFLILRIIQ